jgi:hypothetical protein
MRRNNKDLAFKLFLMFSAIYFLGHLAHALYKV